MAAIHVDTVERHSRPKNPAQPGVLEPGLGARRGETVEEHERELPDGCRAVRPRIRRAGRRVQPCGRCSSDRLSVQETGLPFTQQPGVAAHALTVALDRRAALTCDDVADRCSRRRINTFRFLCDP